MDSRRHIPLKDSHQQEPPPPPPRQLHTQEPPPRRPVLIYTVPPTKVLHVHSDDFKALVQKLTGKSPTSFPSTSATVDASCVGSPDLFFPDVPSKGQNLPSSITRDLFFPVPTTNPQDLGSLNFSVPSPPMADGYWNQYRQHQPPMSSIPHSGPPKRPRFDFGHNMQSYLSRDEDRGIPHEVKDTRIIGRVYDLYLKNLQTPSMPSEEVGSFNGVGIGRPGGNNMMPSPSMGELMTGRGGILPPNFGPNGRAMGFGQQDLVENPACAATVRTALQGYRMDEDEPDYKILQIQFSRNPGPRPGQRGGRR